MNRAQVKAFVTLLVAYLVANPCYYAGYLWETAVMAFATGRKNLRLDLERPERDNETTRQ